ncbi:unnamed protein product, partial [Rotaria magnacalcarata]
VPPNSYALVEGEHYCLTYFLKQHGQLLTIPAECQFCGSKPLSSSKTMSKQSIKKLGSMTSLNSALSSKIYQAARSIGTTITDTFRHLRLSSAGSTTFDPSHK